MMSVAAITPTYAQSREAEELFHDFEARAARGTPGTVDEAEPILERFATGSREAVVETLPLIVHAAADPHVSVRRIAALALYKITRRSDGQALLSSENTTLATLLVDPDIPIRRITILAVHNLRLNASSPLLPVLEIFLARNDAVSTIGAGAATVLMEAAPSGTGATNAVVQFMRRPDQTSATRDIMLDAVSYAKSENHEIGTEVARYADDPKEQTSTHAIETLQSMGKNIVRDNQQSLSRIAADANRTPGVREAAKKALAAAQ